MGNYCDDEIKQIGFPEVPSNASFIQLTWALLKKHQQLSPLSAQDESHLLQQLHNIPHQKNAVKALPLGNTTRCIVLKQDVYLYVGEVKGQRMHGRGAVALSNVKIFIGSFTNGRVEGAGEFHFATSCTSNPKPVRLAGEWGEAVKGTLTIASDDPAFPFSASKDMIHCREGCTYIQYPNYDEYTGETAEGAAHGEGKYIYRNGHRQRQFPVYEGWFSRGVREGKGVMRYSATMELRIKWVSGRPDGNGYLLINGTSHSVLYRAGQRIERLISQFD